MQLGDVLLGLLLTLLAFAKEITSATQQLRLPFGNLIGGDIELIDKLRKCQVTLERGQGNLGLKLRWMGSSRSSHCVSSESCAQLDGKHL